jgi:hemerythrin-like metal-binding protein
MDPIISTVTANTPPTSLSINTDPSMLIGVHSIDREHSALLTQLNRLIENPLAEPASESFADVLSNLGPQISAHFDNEEGVLKSCGMPASEVAEHVEAHTDILEQYAQMNCDLMDGKSLTRPQALLQVKGWIIDHLRRYDSRIKQYLPTER